VVAKWMRVRLTPRPAARLPRAARRRHPRWMIAQDADRRVEPVAVSPTPDSILIGGPSGEPVSSSTRHRLGDISKLL